MLYVVEICSKEPPLLSLSLFFLVCTLEVCKDRRWQNSISGDRQKQNKKNCKRQPNMRGQNEVWEVALAECTSRLFSFPEKHHTEKSNLSSCA